MGDVYERSDEELVEDYLGGDTHALRLLIERYHDPMLRFLLRMLGNRQSAEDVFQETFLQLHQSIETFDLTKRLKPWLFTIAANKARDELRRSQRRQTVSLATPVTSDGEGQLVDLLEIDLPSPDAPIEQREMRRMVQQSVDALPPRLREILLLAYFQKMSYQQIAEHFSIPLGTVKSRLHSAVATFARAWQRQMDEAASSRTEKKTANGGRTPPHIGS